MVRLPISLAAVRRLLAEIESGGSEPVLAVGGAAELASVLRLQFLRGGARPEAVRRGGPEGAAAYLHVLLAEVCDEDVATLRRAARQRVPVIAVAVDFADEVAAIPYVVATDVVRVAAGQAVPLETVAGAIAEQLGDKGAPLAGRVPLLREAVCNRLVDSCARRNALLAAAVWVPGADLPVLALNELRLILRLAQAHGADSARDWVPELAATLGAGYGLRALARELLTLAPRAGWAVKSAVAYGGTRALGETARLRFELGPTRRPGAASRGAP
jgi:uncharacterized protein (DUF697 family)